MKMMEMEEKKARRKQRSMSREAKDLKQVYYYLQYIEIETTLTFK